MARDAPFLSIIVPFHNSAETCGPLLDTLSRLRPEDGVELILVDDGSTDRTRDILRAFERNCPAGATLVERENGGPGAARNSGLDRASGRFVWFVDSDDDIDLAAIAAGRTARWEGIDLVAWEWDHPTIQRRIAPGLHRFTKEPAPPDMFDPIVANWYSMDFLKRTGLRFPEYCVYEATTLEAFVLPLLVSSCFKSKVCAYRGNMASRSVTRQPAARNPRFYDRLQTVALGMAWLRDAGLQPAAMAPFDEAFVRLYLWYSLPLSKLPGRSWLLAMRVIRQFRDEARRLDVRLDPFACYPGRRASKMLMRLLWSLSHALPSQRDYFENKHLRAWGRPIAWQAPAGKS